jgi:hypothetical protein
LAAPQSFGVEVFGSQFWSHAKQGLGVLWSLPIYLDCGAKCSDDTYIGTEEISYSIVSTRHFLIFSQALLGVDWNSSCLLFVISWSSIGKVFYHVLWKIAAGCSGRYCRYCGRYRVVAAAAALFYSNSRKTGKQHNKSTRKHKVDDHRHKHNHSQHN